MGKNMCFLLYHSFNTGNFCVIVLKRWSKRIKKKKITYISVEHSGMRYLRPCILTSQSNGYFSLRGHQGTSCSVPSFCMWRNRVQSSVNLVVELWHFLAWTQILKWKHDGILDSFLVVRGQVLSSLLYSCSQIDSLYISTIALVQAFIISCLNHCSSLLSQTSFLIQLLHCHQTDLYKKQSSF